MQKILVFLMMAFFAGVGSAKAYDETIVQVFEHVGQEYVDKMPVSKMAIYALGGLNKVDPMLRVADDNKRVSVYYKAQMRRNFIKPETEDVKDWAMYVDKIVAFATRISPTLSLKDFELTDVMMSELVSKLDKGSKYYAAADLQDVPKGKLKPGYAATRDGGILYVKLRSFNKDSAENIRKTAAENKDAEAVILDLRGNSGGLLDQVIEVADMFLDNGIIISAIGRTDENDKFYMANEGGELEKLPLVVIVDGNTASSAEVLSGSLREQERAKIIGAKTFGKGSLQKLIELPNGSELALTTAYLQLPSGEAVKEKGIVPDYCLIGYDDGFSGEQILKNKGSDVCDREDREDKKIDYEVAKALVKSIL